MRHNDARKWLHAVLDLLPVLLIPVFMIYSHRHTLTEQTTVDIQYKYQSNEVNTLDDLIDGHVYHLSQMAASSGDGYNVAFQILSYSSLIVNDAQWELDGTYLDINYNSNYGNYLYFLWTDTDLTLSFTNDIAFNDVVTYGFDNFIITDFDFIYSDDYMNYTYLDDYNYLPQYTDYNVIESVDVQDSNSSVMNVFMDNFNTAVDKYFNMGNVFNMNNVYQWFNTNIFGGNAPVVIYSVWNIVLYEFVMDLLFLLYGLFMWFIDICKHLMDKPFRSIK